jgi:hypothetical protein
VINICLGPGKKKILPKKKEGVFFFCNFDTLEKKKLIGKQLIKFTGDFERVQKIFEVQ